MLLEAVHMYSLVASVVKAGGMLSTKQNLVVGWGIPAFIVLFNMCFEYENYGTVYHCWLDMGTGTIITVGLIWTQVQFITVCLIWAQIDFITVGLPWAQVQFITVGLTWA
jgi:hypothetical protein